MIAQATACAGQAASDMRVLVDVTLVVEVDEPVTDRLAEDGKHRQQQQAADGQQAVGLSPLALRERGRKRGDRLPRRPFALGIFRVFASSVVLGHSGFIPPAVETDTNPKR